MKWLWNLLVSWFTVKQEELKPIPEWYKIALGELGVHEIPGADNNKRILEYHRATKLKATEDSIPWCSAFVCWCLEKAGVHSTRQPNARSYLQWGRRIDTPYEGCIAVLSRGESWQGHVGFYVSETPFSIKLLSGNTNDEVCMANFIKESLLEYREPLDLGPV